MPKKSAPARKKNSASAKKRSFMWSSFFFAATAVFNIYFISAAMGINASVVWPLVAACSALLTLLLVGREMRKAVGKNNFMWSIVFAAITVLITFYMASSSNYDVTPLASCAFATIGLIVLYWEKYHA